VASYYVWSAATGSANGTSWANAYTTLTLAFSGKVAGDVFYVAHDHAESTAAAITLTSNGSLTLLSKVVCVDRAGSVPPVSADRRATAQVTTTGANSITINTSTHFDGIIFNAGTGAVTGSLLIATTGHHQRFDNCSLRIVASGTSSILQFGPSGSVAGAYVECNNTTFSFAATAQQINVTAAVFHWRNTPSALLGTIPSVLFVQGLFRGAVVEIIGVDLSAAGSGKTIISANSSAQAQPYRFIDCKLNASVTMSTVPASLGSLEVDFIRCGATGVNYTERHHKFPGLLVEETTIVRTGGASNGTTPISWNIATQSTCTYSMPFECPPIAIWNDTVGSAVTATVEGIWGGGAVPNDDDIWIDVEYLGDASSPQGSFVNDGKADLLATAAGQSSSSATWGGSTTKFKLNVTFTPQQKGWIYARVKCGKASSTFYIDSLVTLT
jgi:hypothetical protein